MKIPQSVFDGTDLRYQYAVLGYEGAVALFTRRPIPILDNQGYAANGGEMFETIEKLTPFDCGANISEALPDNWWIYVPVLERYAKKVPEKVTKPTARPVPDVDVGHPPQIVHNARAYPPASVVTVKRILINLLARDMESILRSGIEREYPELVGVQWDFETTLGFHETGVRGELKL